MFEEGEPLADERMEALSRDLDVPILYGAEVASVVSADSGRRRLTGLYNGALLVTPEGGTVDWYAKRRLLPFIEGVPFAHMLGWNPYSEDRSRSRGSYLTMVGNFRPGPKATIFELGAARIGVLICYEGLYPQLVRTHRLAGANILAVLTNDAWWGESLVPWWHAQLASCRAREAGIPVMRAANHGISSTSNLFGRILDRSDLSEVVVLESEVRIGSAEPTFYARQGDWLIWLVTAVLGVSFARAGVLALIAGRKSVSSGDLSGLPSE
jgi:apolipoprotein N-acyltransferase